MLRVLAEQGRHLLLVGLAQTNLGVVVRAEPSAQIKVHTWSRSIHDSYLVTGSLSLPISEKLLQIFVLVALNSFGLANKDRRKAFSS